MQAQGEGDDVQPADPDADTLSQDMLRKYIVYAKEYIHPKLPSALAPRVVKVSPELCHVHKHHTESITLGSLRHYTALVLTSVPTPCQCMEHVKIAVPAAISWYLNPECCLLLATSHLQCVVLLTAASKRD